MIEIRTAGFEGFIVPIEDTLLLLLLLLLLLADEILDTEDATLSAEEAEEECPLMIVLDDVDVNVLLGVDDIDDIVVFGVLLVFSRRTC